MVPEIVFCIQNITSDDFLDFNCSFTLSKQPSIDCLHS